MDKIKGLGWEIRPYTTDLKPVWDAFVRNARNATFIHERDYMDYHKDRFRDASLMAYFDGKLSAVLPACVKGDTLSSHAGLTFGGWLLPPYSMHGTQVVVLFDVWLKYCKAAGYKKIIYTPIPYIYYNFPSGEDLYAMSVVGFTQNRNLLGSTVDMHSAWKFDMSKRQQVRKALRSGIMIAESDNWDGFWQLLTECLSSRHNAAPVHSAEEIKQLVSKFPENIKLYIAMDEEGMQAGVVVYYTGRVCKAQYTATTERGRRMSYLPALYHYLLTDEYADVAYFDYGTSNEDDGRVLNDSLLQQKCSMGASGYSAPQYSIEL